MHIVYDTHTQKQATHQLIFQHEAEDDAAQRFATQMAHSSKAASPSRNSHH